MPKVNTGQSLVIPASDYNSFIDAAEFVKNRSLNSIANPANSTRQYNVVSILNSTGEDLEKGQAIGIGDPVITPTENEEEFNSRIVMVAELADVDSHFGRFAIMLTNTPQDQYGTALLSGVVQTILNVTSENTGYTFCDLVVAAGSATSDTLEPIPFGSSKILWKDTGTGSDINAVIMLNSQIVTPLFCATSDEVLGEITAKVIDSDGHLSGRDFDFLVVEYVPGS